MSQSAYSQGVEPVEPGRASWIWAVAPLLLGLLAGPCFLYAANRVRSARLAIEGVAYCAATVFYLAAAGVSKHNASLGDAGVFVAFVETAVATARAFTVRERVFSVRRLPDDEPLSVSSSPAEIERISTKHGLSPKFALDHEVAHNLTIAAWGFGEVGKAFAWLLGVIGVVFGVAAALPISAGLGSLVGESGFGIAVWLSSDRARRESGGWRATFGYSLPKPREFGRVGGWFGWQMLGRLVVTAVMLSAVPALRHHPVSNTTGIRETHGVSLALLVIGAVLVAPVVEELFFRGLLLRAAMRRFSFWPAALLSSVLFGIGHGPGARSAIGGVYLAMEMTTFGLIQCLLVRRTARLGPAIGVHALANSLAIAFTLA